MNGQEPGLPTIRTPSTKTRSEGNLARRSYRETTRNDHQRSGRGVPTGTAGFIGEL